jgi:hypothetical protein
MKIEDIHLIQKENLNIRENLDYLIKYIKSILTLLMDKKMRNLKPYIINQNLLKINIINFKVIIN